MAHQHRISTAPYCARFGRIAVELGYLQADQLQAALEEQSADVRAGRPHRVVGAICFAHGWLTPRQIDRVLNLLFEARRAEGFGCGPHANQPELAAGA